MSDILAAYTDKKYMYDLLKADLYTPDRVWISLQEELENVRSDVQMKVHKKVNMELTCDGVDKLYGDKLLVRELFFCTAGKCGKVYAGGIHSQNPEF